MADATAVPDLGWAVANMEFRHIEHDPILGPLLEQLLLRCVEAAMTRSAIAARFGFPIGGIRRVLRRADADGVPDRASAARQRKRGRGKRGATPVSEETLEQFAAGIGDALRQERQKHGWTRQIMNGRLRLDRSVQKLASHERGTRAMSVCQFAEYCAVLGVQPGEIFDRVYQGVFGQPDDTVIVDLAVLAGCGQPQLARWATLRLAEPEASDTGLATLPRSAQDALAVVCGVELPQLLDILSAA
ncbi:helix-turn-helix domain-containing protein [Amycolatopsis saalfeldensis]|uniref:Helix-turn-helix domain-containing protein n=1 Tax=Amycolatopsis saalfeldensis TaxID=394193 RepID=A0A1H8YRR7_9PSEU|nr:helix-turn-helix transcriptional regulator [Amycolatopsis saalfeldensis]SEP54078.1 hypothetical protein SAMN04489732_13635 [Amycolatopsis saalfeldensis]